MNRSLVMAQQERSKIDSFVEQVEIELRKLGLTDQLSRAEMDIVEDFRQLDFGAAPCALMIKNGRK